MTAPVSVVIPTLSVADRIGPCLGALGEGLFSGLIHEVILADGGSGDAIEIILVYFSHLSAIQGWVRLTITNFISYF